jgi:hypothetical protein
LTPKVRKRPLLYLLLGRATDVITGTPSMWNSDRFTRMGPSLPIVRHPRIRKGTSFDAGRSLAMAQITIDYEHKDLTADDVQGIHDFIVDADIVDGPDELYAIVQQLWPELLHKVKPPRSLMH